jgi:hypothetical protein
MARVGARRGSGLLASTKQLLLPRRAYRSAGIGGFGSPNLHRRQRSRQGFSSCQSLLDRGRILRCRRALGRGHPRAFSADPMLRAARRRAVRLSDAIHSPFRRFQVNIEFAIPGTHRKEEEPMPRCESPYDPSTMPRRHVIYERKGHGVCVTLNRPEVLNALHSDAYAKMRSGWRDIGLASEEAAGTRAHAVLPRSHRLHQALEGHANPHAVRARECATEIRFAVGVWG